jgi:hypothetical protein
MRQVAAGEHLDSMRGLPGVDVDGGGAFQYTPDGRLQRIHGRWQPDFRAARDSGRIPPLPPLTPAAPEALCLVEDAIGAALPALFRRCFLELGNGGFGPGYGLLPAPAGTEPEPGTLLHNSYHERGRLLVNGSLLVICNADYLRSMIGCDRRDGGARCGRGPLQAAAPRPVLQPARIRAMRRRLAGTCGSPVSPIATF